MKSCHWHALERFVEIYKNVKRQFLFRLFKIPSGLHVTEEYIRPLGIRWTRKCSTISFFVILLLHGRDTKFLYFKMQTKVQQVGLVMREHIVDYITYCLIWGKIEKEILRKRRRRSIKRLKGDWTLSKKVIC